MSRIELQRGLFIEDAEVLWRFSRSSGSGGQNVNKVSSKAQMRWSPRANTTLPGDVRDRFIEAYAGRLNLEGELVLQSDETRDRRHNMRLCLDRLRAMILRVAEPPKPRVRTVPTRASVKRRLEHKKRLATKKTQRKKTNRADWDSP
jgi:ribosome-associated protein